MAQNLDKLDPVDLLQGPENPDGGKQMLLQAFKELPSATKELAFEAWQSPGETAIHVAKTVGTGAVMGAALGYLIPGRGTVAAIIGTAFTVPAVINTYKHFNGAYTAAQHGDANIDAIAHKFARDAVGETTNFALGTAGGLIGSELGRSLAMSNTRAGEFGQSAQRLVLKAENRTIDALRSIIERPKFSDPIVVSAEKITSPRRDGIVPPHIEAQIQSAANAKLQSKASAAEMEMIYGSLHGHSVYSDGMGKPAEIFAKAHKEGIQFTAITDHNHTAARGGVQPGDPRYPGQQKTPTVAEAPIHYAETMRAANNATKPGEFVALTGIELGTIGKTGSKGRTGVNHMNVLEVETLFVSVKPPPKSILARAIARITGEPPLKDPETIKIFDGNIKDLVTHLDVRKDSTGGRPVIQLNHPRYAADESPSLPAELRGRDYGQKSFKSQAEWRERFGKYASQMELLSGDAIKPNPKGAAFDPRFAEGRHVHDVDYAGYIDKGLHISPTFGRDFHYGDPGGTNAATGVLVKTFDKPGLMDGLRERRTIATTNKEVLSGHMTANGQTMGSILDQRKFHDLDVSMHVAGKVTPDAKYTAKLWGDTKIGDKKLADVLQTRDISGSELAAAGNTIKFDQVKHTIGAKSAFFVELQRIGAKASSERMWTAPIWVEPLGAENHSLAVKAMLGIGTTLIGS